MRKLLFSLILITVLLAVCSYNLSARGTVSGTLLSNLNCYAAYSNTSGYLYTNTSPIVTTTVTQGYDMSEFSRTSAETLFRQVGGTAIATFTVVTNYGNSSDTLQFGTRTNSYSSANWLPVTIVQFTNGSPIAASSNTNTGMDSIDVSAGGFFYYTIRVDIPLTVTNGEWIIIETGVHDSVSPYMGGSGDQWPTVLASNFFGVPPDTTDARDGQGASFTIVIQGPKLILSKSVTNVIRPFEVMEYTIHYTNEGSASAKGLSIIDYIPKNTVITQDSAENNNTLHAGSAIIRYWRKSVSSWTNSTYDNGGIGNLTNIGRVEWALDTDVGIGDAGDLRFRVIVK